MPPLKHESPWRREAIPRFPKSELANSYDVIVIGGGITGLTAAYLLKQSGKRVAVLERERIGGGETGSTSAHLTYVTDMRLAEINSRFGEDVARQVYAAGATAIDLIESNAIDRGISCGFRRVPGFLCSPFCEPAGDATGLQQEAALASQFGFASSFHQASPVGPGSAVRYADQAVFDPLEYLAGLAAAVCGDGSVVADQMEVGSTIDDPLGVIVDGRTITCDDLIIATHVPLAGNTSLPGAVLFQSKLYPYSSYVVGARVDRDDIQPGLYFDTADPYYYFRVHDDSTGRYVVFGGRDHKTGQETDTASRFDEVQKTLLTLLPSSRIERRWSGQVIETDDGLPFIGQTAEHQYVGTGYAGNGLTFGTIAGMMIRDAIMNVAHPLAPLLDPHRKARSVDALATFVAENVDYPFFMIADRLRRSLDTVREIAPGDGKVLTIGGRRVACHRTDAGELLKVSAVCTHLGCLVRWNGAERSWDCPCHGSRFTPEGLVIGGPAEAPLERLD